jgi:hypothetical protein
MTRNRALRVLASAAEDAQNDLPEQQIAAVVAEVRQ